MAMVKKRQFERKRGDLAKEYLRILGGRGERGRGTWCKTAEGRSLLLS